MNAKLYPILNYTLNDSELSALVHTYLIGTNMESRLNPRANYDLWRTSMRLSMNEIISIASMDRIFANRRRLANTINLKRFIDSIITKQPYDFLTFIRNAIADGFVRDIIDALDNGKHKYLSHLLPETVALF
jgi:hypothetical protein